MNQRTLLLLLAIGLVLPSRHAQASLASTPTDPAALLRAHGALAVDQAGPYVHRGSFRIQVATKLGSPDAILPDGTWLYHSYAVPESAADGTLVVRFANGRVSEIVLASSATVSALRSAAGWRAASAPDRPPAPGKA
jgi:hypothetical protein